MNDDTFDEPVETPRYVGAETVIAAFAVAAGLLLAIALVVALGTAAAADTHPHGDTPRPGPTVVVCTGAIEFTAGVSDHLVAVIIAAAFDRDDLECTAPDGMTAGNYRVGDLVFNGHHADEPTLAACRAAFADSHLDQRHCVRIAACESGSIDDYRITSRSNDWGRWQHHGPYIPDRLAAIGMPDADPLDLWVNAQMTAWYVDQLGRWGGTAGWACAARTGAF